MDPIDTRNKLELALDDLVSPRSTLVIQGKALSRLEKILADTFLANDDCISTIGVTFFLQLQDTFQCNIASRVLVWLARQIDTLKKGHSSDEDSFKVINDQVILALSLLQGAALVHRNSKVYLSRKYPIEVLLDLLSASRYGPTKPLNRPTNAVQAGEQQGTKSIKYPRSLASVTLDTLLCVLVDMPEATRIFEESDGIELVVKTLKRASIPRDVRMKCLEFLYFYLMDETASSRSTSEELHPQTRPHSSMLARRPNYIQPEEVQHSIPNDAIAKSWSKSNSTFSSFSPWSPTPTLAETPPQSPTKRSKSRVLKVSSSAPPSSLSSSRDPQHGQQPQTQLQQDVQRYEEPNHERGPFAMLRSDVDFVPLSPKKAQISKLGLGNRRMPGSPGPGTPPLRFPLKQQMSLGGLDNVGSASSPAPHRRDSQQRRPSPLSRDSSEATLLLSDGEDGPESEEIPQQRSHPLKETSMGADDIRRTNTQITGLDPDRNQYHGLKGARKTRTTEEKKEILGQLLGNVDALVEGVKNAGIWGLAG